ncbi:hypothetical protein GVO57_07805 [Sphingomonas changnyeongensis]|uniref:Uncharacterized protein n=1 Tax=Sphingomonas changnyeongensis TaxID=2698679 RepID=A0A7Z2NVU5_9SPHN|nr:hypothetical protein [Sphingomonas changnyeongensis]QHL90753.1 hypothetical protein GVO57_07805 [Sphingomonas changnyeongensis]
MPSNDGATAWRTALPLTAIIAGVMALGGCTDIKPQEREQRAGEVRVNADPELIESDAPVATAGPPPAWSVNGATASFGAAGEAPLLALSCDRARGQIIVERAGDGDVLTLRAGDVEKNMPARPAGTARVQARLAAGDPLFAAMAAPQAQILLIGGAGEQLTLPGGVSVRRVREACLGPEPAPEAAPPPPTEPAVPTGSKPL